MIKMKFIEKLTDSEKLTLEEAYKNHPSFRCRQRAQALLLNNRGYTAANLCQFFDNQQETVCHWLNNWIKKGLSGLRDAARSGRPSIFTEIEQTQFLHYIDENPHQIKKAAAKIEEETGKKASIDAYKRILKKKHYGWKRCRHSLREKRDEEVFQKDKEVLRFLKEKEDDQKINLYFFDESGFSTTPCIPYGWQRIGETYELPKQRSPRLNVLGFLSRKNDAFFHTVDSSMTSETVIEAFDVFSEKYWAEYQQHNIPCLIILDNASIHHSTLFNQRKDYWMARGVCLHYLPTYSPELNIIEILWRKIKYEWLSFDAYQSYAHLKKNVLKILDNIGEKYWITFT